MKKLPPSRVVIIDDEQRMCDSLAALLRDEGYEVAPFQRSPEALQAIQGGKVDLVVTDIKMPDMDGLEILRHVKAIDEGIPVILLTAYASLDSAVEAIGKGAYDYLMKPVEFNRLALSVSRALEHRHAELARLRLVEELRLSNLILQQRVGELNALYEAGKSIGSSANPRELLRQIVVLAASVTEANVGSIMLVDPSGQHLTIEAAIGLDEEIVNRTRLPLGASIAGFVAQAGEPLMVDDVEQDERFRRINRERYGAASLLCAPLRIKNAVLGVINMANKSGGQKFTEDDLRLLTNFASQAAVAIDDAAQFEKNRRRLTEFEILHEVSRELPAVDSFVAFRNLLVEKLRRVFPIDFGVWFDWHPAERTLLPAGAIGETNIPLTDSGKIDISRISRNVLSLPDLYLESFDFENITGLSELIATKLRENDNLPGPGSANMAIPILRSGELVNLFYLGADSQRPYSADDIALARLVISQAALLFEKEKAMLNATRLISMGNMISEISHDLRKPLTSIRGGLQILRQRWPDVAEKSEFFQTAEQEIHRMNDLVRELVDFSNPKRYETSKTDLRQIVIRASELVGPELRKRQVRFEADFTEANWEVIVNRNQLTEVFLNLFMNAIDAMPEGGNLTVKGTVEHPPHRNENYLAIKVIDTGVGIKRENLSRVFERYYTTKETGTGLGLSVVERVISAHGGTVHITSKVGQGTAFTVYLPYRP